MSDAGTDIDVKGAASEIVRRPSRLRALAALDANAESAAQALDRIARIACRVLDVPVALVNLVGADEQRFVGCGTPEQPWVSTRVLPMTYGFCPFAVGTDAVYALPDARLDAALAANPAVVQLGVVAYAGVPLRTADGEPVGTLCAIDHRPREWSEHELTLLADLAASAIAELQLLSATRLVSRQRTRLRELTQLSSTLAGASTPSEVVAELGPPVARLGASAAWLLMLDETRQELRAAGSPGAEALAPVPLEAQGALGEVVRSGQADFLQARADVRDRLALVGELLLEVGAAAVLPLAAGERRLGVLGVCFAAERPFPEEDREYLAALAGMASLALVGAPG